MKRGDKAPPRVILEGELDIVKMTKALSILLSEETGADVTVTARKEDHGKPNSIPGRATA